MSTVASRPPCEENRRTVLMGVSGCGTSAVRAAHRSVTFVHFYGSKELTTAGMTGRAGHFMPLPPATT